MGIGSGTAMLIGGLAGAGGSVASGIMGSNAAQNAAAEQTQAANHAADLQYQESQNALGFEQQQYNQNQANLQPWLQSGASALGNLNYLMGNGPSSGAASVLPPYTPAQVNGVRPTASNPRSALPNELTPAPTASGMPAVQPTPLTAAPTNTSLGAYGSLMQPYSGSFQAPTEQQMEQNDPGYQARMNLGQQAMEQSAAARGNLLTGGTLQAENQLAQDYASNEYNNFYNQAYNQYAANYNQYNQGQANQFNKLAALSGVGQTAANTLGSLGQSASNNVSSNLLSTGQQIGNDIQNAGNANASGIVGSANALGGMASGIGNNTMQLAMLNSMYGTGNPYQVLNNAQNSEYGVGSGLQPTTSSLNDLL